VSDRALLARLCRGPASGAVLARELGITRSAVWKRIQGLRAAGVDVQAQPGRGYALARAMQLLEADALVSALSPEARAQLAGLSVLFEADSTNAIALREPAAASGCKVWLAERQTAGRGRRGRDWASPLAANVYLSVSRQFQGGLAALQGLSLAVGVAAAEALHGLGYAQVGIKWPNDLFAHGRKLGGVLVEVGGETGGPVRVVIGLGLNVSMPAAAAQGIDQAWCDLDSLGAAPASRQDVCVALLDALLPMLARFEHTGLAPMLERWARLDLLAGRRVRVTDAGQAFDGVACGIDADGALRVRLAGGERRFHAGEASLRAA
jgi:BirA family biotin operon repressor/biotin-[acetyl-CoA-carboxylase] ligase